MSTRQCDEFCGLQAGYCRHGAQWGTPAPGVRADATRSLRARLRSRFKLRPGWADGDLDQLDAILELELAGLNIGLAARVLASLPDLPGV